jgi:hypothetical protein
MLVRAFVRGNGQTKEVGHRLSARFDGLPHGAVRLDAGHGLFVVAHRRFVDEERRALPATDEALRWEGVRRETASR